MSQDVEIIKSSGSPLGMGWSITGFFPIGTFFIGIVMILVAFLVLNAYPQYRNNINSKLSMLIVAWVGLGLFTFAMFATYFRFRTVVQRMNKQPKFFSKEGFQNSAAALETNLREIEKLRTRLELTKTLPEP